MKRTRKNPFENNEGEKGMPALPFDLEDVFESPKVKSILNKYQRETGGDVEEIKKVLTEMFFNEAGGDEKMVVDDLTPDQWRLTNLEHEKCGSDKFYAGVATELARGFAAIPGVTNLPAGAVDAAAFMMSAYLEDIVSELGVWQAFRNLYRRRFGKILPFYDVDEEDYFEDDLNIDDLRLIAWIAFNRTGKYYGRIFSPVSEAVYKFADIGMDILTEKFDGAPAATRMRDKLKRIFKQGDFFKLRGAGLWLNADFPLTSVPFMRRAILEDANEYINMLADHDMDPDMTQAYYMAEVAKGWQKYMGPIGGSSWEYLAEIADIWGFGELAAKLRGIEVVPFGTYNIDEVKGNYVTLTDILDKSFLVWKDSMGAGVNLNEMKGVGCSLVKFGDSYWQSGLASFADTPMKAPEKRVVLNYLPDEQLKIVDDTVRENDGRRVFYCRNTKEVSKVLGYKLEPKQINELENAGDAGHVEFEVDLDEADNLLLMLSSEAGPIIKEDICRIFKDKKNPYRYQRATDSVGMDALSFIVESVLPDDVINYIVDNDLLPAAYMNASQGKKAGKAIVQENMGYMFRFFRVGTFPHPEDYNEYGDGDYDDDDFDDEDDV